MERRSDKIINGLQLIKQSVLLVIAHPVLLLYSVCSFALSSLIILLAMLIVGISHTSIINAQTASSFFLPVCILIALLTCVNLFFFACLAHHAMHKLKKETHGFKDTLRDVIYKLPTLSIWFAFKICLYIFWILIPIYIPLTVVTIAVSWSIATIIGYVTSLVLPILATEKTGVIAAVKRSCRLATDYFMVLIGIFLIFSLFGSTNLLSIFVQQLEVLTYTIFYYDYYIKREHKL